MKRASNIRSLLLMTATSLLLTACGSVDRMANIGAAPAQTAIESPTLKPGYKPVTMPMPASKSEERQANSLWTGGGSRKTFFEDQRADDVGDILTVTINIKDDASLKNESSRDRDANESAAAPNVLGFENYIGKAFPDAVDPTQLLDLTTTSAHKGAGEIKREEEVNLKVAAIVSQILPNGNLVIQGRQEVRVNYENRILELTGIIRPEDISIDNTIGYEKVAEARISYGGKGQITDVQQPRYGQQVMDILSPF